MKERPILFSGPMVRAILGGHKTQTRRIAKFTSGGHLKEPGGHRRWHRDDPNALLACPYGQPGDRLWVRETFAQVFGTPAVFEYRAGGGPGGGSPFPRKWTPSIFMPRKASRITLEITKVRVEQLQDISDGDAVAEGIERVRGISCDGWRHYTDRTVYFEDHLQRESYRSLWESINSLGSWDANPWVWALTFKHIK